MAQVKELAQHILKLQPEKDAPRLCFYHYLINLCDATDEVNSELLERFFRRALNFKHWQENKEALFREVQSLLHHFEETAIAAHRRSSGPQPTGLNLADVCNPGWLQVVNAESVKTLERALQRHLEDKLDPYDRFRLFAEGNDLIVAIILKAGGSIQAQTHSRALGIVDGELVPLYDGFQLTYSPELTLDPAVIQELEVGPHASARFRVTPQGIRGHVVRGYSFQNYSSMSGGALSDYPILFYPLKRLEQFFINRKTDPMYVELTTALEKALDLSSQPRISEEDRKFAAAAVDRGRLALEHIFPDDKIVRYLIENLEEALAATKAKDEKWQVNKSV